MIVPGTRFAVAVVPLARILVTEHQPRYPDRALHYVRLLADPAHARDYAGLVHLKRAGTRVHNDDALTCEPLYELLDGHHRFVGSVLAGRKDVLALILTEPDQPGYELRPGVTVDKPCECESATDDEPRELDLEWELEPALLEVTA